jgi:F-type H+-transporting ATPase subunit gamma
MSLRDVKLRMRAIRQTLQVTKAMKLISTAKMRKGRKVLEDTVPFFTRIQKTMYDLLSGANNLKSDFLGRPDKPPEERHTAIVAVTSDKGLAGGYNANVFRCVNEVCQSATNPVLILIGQIGYRYFQGGKYPIMNNFSLKSRLPTVDDAMYISDYLVSQYDSGAVDEIRIVYTHMFSSVRLTPVQKAAIPLSLEKVREELIQMDSRNEARPGKRFEYVPSQETVFEALIPFYVKGILYGCMIEAYASEQSTRVSAMDEASRNADDMLATLQVYYNRVRQQGITQEITEIVSGSAALSDQ